MNDYEKLEGMLKDFEDTFGEVDATMSDSFNCWTCGTICMTALCASTCYSAVMPYRRPR